MDAVLVDTSVWINFFKNIETESCKFLSNNLTNVIIATCPTIVQEVLQGILTRADEKIVETHFGLLTRLVENPYEVAVEAAELYRDLRKRGITIRKPNDCLIAVYAIRNKMAVLNDDRDFRMIAQHYPLKIVSFDE